MHDAKSTKYLKGKVNKKMIRAVLMYEPEVWTVTRRLGERKGYWREQK